MLKNIHRKITDGTATSTQKFNKLLFITAEEYFESPRLHLMTQQSLRHLISRGKSPVNTRRRSAPVFEFIKALIPVYNAAPEGQGAAVPIFGPQLCTRKSLQRAHLFHLSISLNRLWNSPKEYITFSCFEKQSPGKIVCYVGAKSSVYTYLHHTKNISSRLYVLTRCKKIFPAEYKYLHHAKIISSRIYVFAACKNISSKTYVFAPCKRLFRAECTYLYHAK